MRGRSWMLGVLAALLVAAAWTFPFHPSQEHMTEVAWEWAALAPLPPSATNYHIRTSGSAFTRTFHILFDAPPADIAEWIVASPGPRGTHAVPEANDTILYEYRASGGANCARIWIKGRRVRVEAAWS